MRRIAAATLLSSGLIAMLATPANAYRPPGTTIRVSTTAGGDQASGSAGVLSGDGSAIAFNSSASLVPEDTNGVQDIYVRDLRTGALQIVSVSSGGAPGDDVSLDPSISADGKVVVFESDASNLVAGDTNGVRDVFAHDRTTGTTVRVSEGATGQQPDAASRDPYVSGDGRFVAFVCEADNIVPGDASPYEDVMLRDLQTGSLAIVGLDSDERQTIFDPNSPSLDHDGSVVAWSARSPTLELPDANGVYEDVFVRDLVTGTTQRVSDSPTGAQGTSHSLAPVLSADGGVVAFASLARNLVPGDANGVVDVFVHDRTTGRTERASVSSTGAEGNHVSSIPDLSADGRFVAFHGAASNLDPNVSDTNGGTDVFVHDRLTGLTEEISVTAAGTTGLFIASAPSISDDGSLVSFTSDDGGFVADDTNFASDTFVRDRGPAVGIGGLSASEEGGVAFTSGFARFAGAVLTSKTDPAADTGFPAGFYGGEIVDASVSIRPELEDLLFTMDLASLPGAEGTAASPTLTYVFAFSVEAVGYQVTVTAPRPASPSTATLSRCTPGCTAIGPVAGSVGTSGQRVTAAVPLEAIGAQAGSLLRAIGISVRENLGAASRSPDSVYLTDVRLPETSVALGRAPAGVPAGQVSFDTSASLQEGLFSGPVGGSGAMVWARACIGELCGVRSAPLA